MINEEQPNHRNLEIDSEIKEWIMVKKSNVYSRVALYFSFLSLAVCRNSSALYDEFDCKKATGINSTIICKSYSNGYSILPVEQVPHDTESLIITTTNGSLAITSIDMFRNFTQLQNLEIHIGKSLYVIEKLLDSISINHLEKVLFSAPKLENLSITYTEYNNESYSWLLPASVKKLYLSNGIFNFDFRECRHLASIQLNWNKLSKMPSFDDLNSSLEILDLRNNPLDEFTVNDIAGLCNLKYFAMDTSMISSCECNELNKWIVNLEMWEDFKFDGNFTCNNTFGGYFNCAPHDAIIKREKCKKFWNRTDDVILSISRISPMIIPFILIFSCCCSVLLICMSICNMFQGGGSPGYGYGYGMPGRAYGPPRYYGYDYDYGYDYYDRPVRRYYYDYEPPPRSPFGYDDPPPPEPPPPPPSGFDTDKGGDGGNWGADWGGDGGRGGDDVGGADWGGDGGRDEGGWGGNDNGGGWGGNDDGGGRGGDNYYTGETDARDNADNEAIN